MVVRVCRVIGILLLIAPAVFAADDPPAELRFVDGHWTAWSPPDPSTFPEGSTVYVIERGDTLWGLAAELFGDGYLWPQLWENNTWILDAHWIYPGDPLLVVSGPMADQGGDMMAESSADMTEEEFLASLLSADDAPIPFALASTSDVFCYGYIGHEEEDWPGVITSFEDTEVKYQEGAMRQEIGGMIDDVVYISGGTSAGLYAGEEYMVVARGELVERPRDGEIIGRQYDYRGRVRILCSDEEEATGLIVQACDSVLLGHRLKPVPTVPIPLAVLGEFERHCETPSGRSEGQIVDAKDHHYALGEGMMVQVDLGSDDSIVPGDFLTVWRPNRVEGYPRLILGEIGVVATDAHTAIGKIVRMRYSMEVGDFVELK